VCTGLAVRSQLLATNAVLINFQTVGKKSGISLYRHYVRITLCYGVISVSVTSFPYVKGLHNMMASLDNCISDESYTTCNFPRVAYW
jgi:hypothetical protein